MEKMKFFRFASFALAVAAAALSFVCCSNDDDAEELVGNWVKVSDFDGVARCSAVTFTVDGTVYVAAGGYGGYKYRLNDLWRFNENSGTWTEKRKIANVSDDDYDDDYGTIARSYGAAFTMYGLGYFTCGEKSGSGMTSTWEYNPAKDRWTERTSFEAGTRSESVGFSINDRGFVLTGKSGTYQYDDKWEFFPRDEYDELD